MNPGERIKKLRKEKGMTQKDLAKKIGVSPSEVNQFEKQTYLRRKTLNKIAGL